VKPAGMALLLSGTIRYYDLDELIARRDEHAPHAIQGRWSVHLLVGPA
jgi:hypothetical protein